MDEFNKDDNKFATREQIISYCEYLTTEINDLKNKDWLSVALGSACKQEFNRRNLLISPPEIGSAIKAWFEEMNK